MPLLFNHFYNIDQSWLLLSPFDLLTSWLPYEKLTRGRVHFLSPKLGFLLVGGAMTAVPRYCSNRCCSSNMVVALRGWWWCVVCISRFELLVVTASITALAFSVGSDLWMWEESSVAGCCKSDVGHYWCTALVVWRQRHGHRFQVQQLLRNA